VGRGPRVEVDGIGLKVVRGAVAERPLAVVAPALHARAEQAAGVDLAADHALRAGDRRDLGRGPGRVEAARGLLAVLVRSPAPDGALGRHGAGVIAPEADVRGAGDRVDLE